MNPQYPHLVGVLVVDDETLLVVGPDLLIVLAHRRRQRTVEEFNVLGRRSLLFGHRRSLEPGQVEPARGPVHLRVGSVSDASRAASAAAAAPSGPSVGALGGRVEADAAAVGAGRPSMGVAKK